jgi:hypothetical protein
MIAKTLLGFACALAGLALGPVQAQVADLSRASCGQLLDLPRSDRGQLIVWLHGYFAGAAQRPVLDRAGLDAAAAGIQQRCEQDRNLPLIGIEARAVFLGQPLPQPGPATSRPQ